KLHLAGCRGEDAREHVEERRLARSIWADEPQDAPFLEVQVHSVERHHAAEPACHLRAGEELRGHVRPRSPSRRRICLGSRPTGRKMRISTTIAAKSRNRYSCRTWSFSGRTTMIAEASATPHGFPTPPRSRIETSTSDSPKL